MTSSSIAHLSVDMRVSLRLGFLMLLLIDLVQSTPIDNAVVGTPIVQCDTNAITMRIGTQRPFQGRIFVKGMSRFTQCVSDYSINGPVSSNTLAEITIPLGNCEMQRNRMLNPNGMQQSLVVVVSFHPIFVTKVDKAYNVKCFFMDAARVLTHGLQVSMLTTANLFDAMVAPECEYTVRRGGVSGPLVRYATVGEKLFHVWRCDSGGAMGILVRNCVIEDGGNFQFVAIDGLGCSTDDHVMGDLQYSNDLQSAFVETHAFKFADDVSLFFKCEISMCNLRRIDEQLGQTSCTGITPPVCGNNFGGFGIGLNANRPSPSDSFSPGQIDTNSFRLGPTDADSFNPGQSNSGPFNPVPVDVGSFNPGPAVDRPYQDSSRESRPPVSDHVDTASPIGNNTHSYTQDPRMTHNILVRRRKRALDTPVPGVITQNNSQKQDGILVVDVSPSNGFIILDPSAVYFDQLKTDLQKKHKEKLAAESGVDDVMSSIEEGLDMMAHGSLCNHFDEWPYSTAAFGILAGLVSVAFLLSGAMLFYVCTRPIPRISHKA